MKKLLTLLTILTVIFISVYPPENVSAAPSYAFLQSTVDTSSQTTYTFSAVNLGVAAADRQIIVVVSGSIGDTNAGATFTGTIGGVAATVVSTAKTAAGSDADTTGIMIANVPTGTTGDITVTWSAGRSRMGIGTYRATGIVATPTDTQTDVHANASVNQTPSVAITVPSGGFAICGSSIPYTDFTFSGWTNATVDYNELLEGTARHTGATATASATITATWVYTGTAGPAVLACNAWGGVAVASQPSIISDFLWIE